MACPAILCHLSLLTESGYQHIMCNRFIKFLQGKHASKQTHSEKTSAMTPEKVHAELKRLFLSPQHWLGRKGANMFLVDAKQKPGFDKKVTDTDG